MQRRLVKGIGHLTVLAIAVVALALTGGITACLALHVFGCLASQSGPHPASPQPTPGTATVPSGQTISSLQQQAASQAALEQSQKDQCAATNPTGPVNDPNSPCSAPGLKIFFPGADTWDTTIHDLNAILNHPIWAYLVKSPGPGARYRNWYDRTIYYPQDVSNPCYKRPKGDVCDEYPFFTTIYGGPFQNPQPSLAVTSLLEGQRQGGYISRFYQDPACGLVNYDPINGGFFVVPAPIAPKNFWICNK
jgi:hypothetical protein